MSTLSTAALVRVKESVELTRAADLMALLDSEDWIRIHLRMAWALESEAKEGVYLAGEGSVKAFQELRKVVGWLDSAKATSYNTVSRIHIYIYGCESK